MRQLNWFFPLLVGLAMPFAVYRVKAGELRLASLRAASAYSATRRGYSFLVIQEGRVIYESLFQQ